MMMKQLTLPNILALWLVIMGFSLPATAADVQQLWLSAESASKTPPIAVSRWKEVLAALPKGKSAGEGLTHDAAKMQLFQALLNQGTQEKKLAPIKEAQEVAAQFLDHRKIFADIMIGKTAAPIDRRFAFKALKLAKANALRLKDRKKRSESLHAIALTMLTQNKDGKLLFGWDGPEMAEDITPYVELSKHRSQLMQRLAVHQQVPKGEWEKSLHDLVKITDSKLTEKRNAQLLELAKRAAIAEKTMIALDALSAITDPKIQQEHFYQWFEDSFKKKEYSRAAMFAGRLSQDKYATRAWGKLAEHYQSIKETVRAKDAAEKSFQSAMLARRDDRRMEILLDAADYAAASGNPGIAQKALNEAGVLGKKLSKQITPKIAKAMASYIKAIAEKGQISKAQKLFEETALTDIKHVTLAVTAIAKSMAEKGRAKEAFEFISAHKLETNKRTDKGYYAISKAAANKALFDIAKQSAERIQDKALRVKAEAFSKARQQKHSAGQQPQPSQESALKAPFFSTLDRDIRTLPAKIQEDTRIELADMFIDEAALPIKKWATLVRTPHGKDRMIALEAIHLVKQGKIKDGSRHMKKVDDPIRRARGFRRLAKEVSLHTDLFGLIGGKKDPIIEQTKQAIYAAEDETQKTSKQIVSEFAELSQKKESGLELAAPEASDLGLTIPDFDYPERLEFDYDFVKAQLPPLTPFTLDTTYYENSFFINTKFKIAIAYSDDNFNARNVVPEILYLSKGTTTLPMLYDALKSKGLDGYIKKEGKEYTLLNGLLVGPEAGLVIDGNEVSKLYQSKQASAILVNGGNLYITGTSVVGWDMQAKAPAYAENKDRYDFRPFIAGWSRSHTYLAGSEFTAIGYSNHKSYGISFSAGPEKLQFATITEPQRPDGIIVDNSFDNVYYGFYSYEADNVSLIGNEYKNNIIYGIDPHDRSRWLTIAYNTAYGAHKKHGIIISREVNDSSFVGNLSFDNKGSGFMIDRLSTGTFVYGNTAFGNKQDGLTLFESSCNFISSNHFFDNKSMGIRVRNSQDNGIFFNRLANNRQAAVGGYISELLDDPAHKRRNFALDPYADVAAMSLVGNEIDSNGTGISAHDMTALVMRGNRFINQSPRLFSGSWFTDHSYFSSQYDLDGKGVYMGETCPKGKWIHHSCRFRNMGLYGGDGQHNLEQRVVNSSCAVPSKQDTKGVHAHASH